MAFEKQVSLEVVAERNTGRNGIAQLAVMSLMPKSLLLLRLLLLL
jgi:hypothetical protein